jgi:C4-dicarboxylate-specific signal transduction histidine kinase
VTTEYFRFAPDILRRLGEELIQQPEHGLIELVRNAYDADASHCRIELENTDKPGGTVFVRDDGNGMTAADIARGWLVLGHSQKSVRSTGSSRRLPVGNKGLGRLAALRLGRSARLVTRPLEVPGREFRLLLDWELFDRAEVVEDVPVVVEQHSTDKKPGTEIQIVKLVHGLGSVEVERLARALVLLSDPFKTRSGFRVTLAAPDFKNMERLVKNSYLDQADYQLSASLDGNGLGSATLADWRGKIRWRADHSELASRRRGNDLPERYAAPKCRIELWTFLLKQDSLHRRRVDTQDLKQWLKAVGGVHLYHRGLRVSPYGDPGHDWLEMNLSRSRDPEERPSTNNSVGRVVVLDPTEELIQKTDRTGFIENEAFYALRSFARDSLEWMRNVRLRERAARHKKIRKRAPEEVASARAALIETVKSVAPQRRVALEASIKKYDTAREKELRVLRDELELYRTLGSVGTTLSVFSHEGGRFVSHIELEVRAVQRRVQKILVSQVELVSVSLERILRSCSSLKAYMNIPIRLLRKGKRRVASLDINDVISDIVALLSPLASAANVRIDLELARPLPSVRGTAAAVEAIGANLLTNAIAALISPAGPLEDRRILIQTQMYKEGLVIEVADNGPGIKDIPVGDIWLPGKSTRAGGTGLGLTIVRDAVLDLGGNVVVESPGSLGGADFIVTLPLSSEGL